RGVMTAEGGDRIRTGVRGFAGLCLTSRPPRLERRSMVSPKGYDIERGDPFLQALRNARRSEERGCELPPVPPLGAGHPDGLRRGIARRAERLGGGGPRRPGGKGRSAVRRARRPTARRGARTGRNRPEARLRDQRRQVLQV